MVRNGYSSVSIPEEIADQIDEFIQKKKHGYRSRAQFLIDAAKDLLEELLDDSES
jgi:metal-responsive CopG/Arc/MetJ family transcriptional regulator